MYSVAGWKLAASIEGDQVEYGAEKHDIPGGWGLSRHSYLLGLFSSKKLFLNTQTPPQDQLSAPPFQQLCSNYILSAAFGFSSYKHMIIYWTLSCCTGYTLAIRCSINASRAAFQVTHRFNVALATLWRC